MLQDHWWKTSLLLLVACFITEVQSRVGYSSKGDTDLVTVLKCNGTDGEIYECKFGHCCENDTCCLYYYELWWFWLIWSVVILISCCCLYHHRQKRLEQRLQRRPRRTKDLYEGVCNYPGPPLENNVLGFCKLPVYKDVIRMPPSSSPPPPYSARRRSIHTIACLHADESGETRTTIINCNITGSMLSVASLSHYMPELLAKNSITPPAANKPSSLADSNNNTQVNMVDELKFIQEKTTGSSTQCGFGPPVRYDEASTSDTEILLKSKNDSCDDAEDDYDVTMTKQTSQSKFNNNIPPAKERVKKGNKTFDSEPPQYYTETHYLMTRDDVDMTSSLGSGINGSVVLDLAP